MRQLELLAPARDKQVGIAAIDCGADAVYIAGPRFGARQAAGNTVDDIRELCEYAHRFGARVFVALNTILYDDELEDAFAQMLEVQNAGVDALIIQDMAILEMAAKGIGHIKDKFTIPIHASTQCAIRTPEQAVFLESLGFSRLILERELSLEQIKAIRNAVSCELEFFVHGALCVCYSGQCYLSEKVAGRSANRGACIQACRSRYDLTDSSGRVIIKDKALLSLKDYNLRNRIEELAEAGITSFKIEGRLKNISYVRNVVRDYSIALDELVNKYSELYERGSFGSVNGSFIPDLSKTFNRGYTELFIDGKRGKWAAMEATKSIGEEVGEVITASRDKIVIRPRKKGMTLNNGDGFTFIAKDGSISGFRGDVCEGMTIKSRNISGIYPGATIFRNVNAAFEKELERQACTRELAVKVSIRFESAGSQWQIVARAESEDGRIIEVSNPAGSDSAKDVSRMLDIIRGQVGKAAGHYRFQVAEIDVIQDVPFMSASFLNGIRRELAESLEQMPCNKKEIMYRDYRSMYKDGHSESDEIVPTKDILYKANVSNRLSEKIYSACGAASIEQAYELSHKKDAELMRTKYCIRYELGLCPKHHGSKDNSPLFLLNNGQRFALHFDCRNCEMTLKEA